MPVVLPEPTNSGLYATNRVYITAVFDRDTRRQMDRDRVNAAALASGNGPKEIGAATLRRTDAPAVFAVFTGNYQRTRSPPPQKTWSVEGAGTERTAGSGSPNRCEMHVARLINRNVV